MLHRMFSNPFTVNDPEDGTETFTKMLKTFNTLYAVFPKAKVTH